MRLLAIGSQLGYDCHCHPGRLSHYYCQYCQLDTYTTRATSTTTATIVTTTTNSATTTTTAMSHQLLSLPKLLTLHLHQYDRDQTTTRNYSCCSSSFSSFSSCAAAAAATVADIAHPIATLACSCSCFCYSCDDDHDGNDRRQRQRRPREVFCHDQHPHEQRHHR